VAPSDGQRVYALIEADKGGLFRSSDGGDTWELVISSDLAYGSNGMGNTIPPDQTLVFLVNLTKVESAP